MKMEALDPSAAACFMVDVDDDLLNFSLEDETVLQDDDEKTTNSITKYKHPFSSSSSSFSSNPVLSLLPSQQHPECVEEELEWLSNKDAFPAVEFGILADNPSIVFDHHSPVSVLENSSSTCNSSGNGSANANAYMSCCASLKVPVNYPVRARSKRRRRRRRGSFADLPSEHCMLVNKPSFKIVKQREPLLSLPMNSAKSACIGRRCQHCGADKTPQWRAGPLGPKTLCNACGVRYKSGRLLPEYRPANSPTFSPTVHSNSHRKVLEMRKQKIGVGGMMIHEACGYSVG
ncbi:GATA transcription factor 1-like isoform X1 [Nicotiana tabacum]|uniref:GATA transcription factor 1-like isoform X1 n=1 Tax=Nicotiana tabacum TaxID=4097 RepID=A0A1S3XWA2_TOBAC|nr:GATA transcription factor 1-like isoform X1 [Nicotiana tomentosiformis]XP_016444155.1 PREDICTED: GATA transcription factor 1-like isoform X1 [Nicotiana tabacum]